MSWHSLREARVFIEKLYSRPFSFRCRIAATKFPSGLQHSRPSTNGADSRICRKQREMDISLQRPHLGLWSNKLLPSLQIAMGETSIPSSPLAGIVSSTAVSARQARDNRQIPVLSDVITSVESCCGERLRVSNPQFLGRIPI